jgi:hypothetical protein
MEAIQMSDSDGTRHLTLEDIDKIFQKLKAETDRLPKHPAPDAPVSDKKQTTDATAGGSSNPLQELHLETANYTEEEIEALRRESVHREKELIKEYKRTHYVPSRGIIITPEIQAERDKQKALFIAYRKLSKKL